MGTQTKNDVKNVTSAQPDIAGAIYRAPLGTVAPLNAYSKLDPAFKNLGYVSDDGLTNSNSPETETKKAWGGATILTSQTGRPDTLKYKLVEALNVEVLKSVYGDNAVTGELETGITVDANNKQLPSSCYVVDMVLKDDSLKRIVIPNATLTSLGDVVYKDGEIVGYEVTLTALPDETGSTHKEYIISAEGAKKLNPQAETKATKTVKE